ncbi:TonB-dependent receptor domain-containing protein [Chitinimonas koreensis]|uniref:TonB-dependent receptor domain-containing protein n=1 Tax=Chitinimonas koreensis TaxID=356302 RepID=UPI0004299DC0|nr:TonB-dependent receptor [Chitinimonas koreensis]QNM95710.1 TonB-dependent receptor [Chitinimonas koreensis]
MKPTRLIAALLAAGMIGGAYAADAPQETTTGPDGNPVRQPDDETAAPPAKPAGGAKPAERIVVTGSNIKRINAETASPLQIVTKKEIESMGARTLLQVLDNLPAMRPAQRDNWSLFTGSDGASQANLRGLGAQGTLVLLNGRRLSYYGAPAGFQTQFVNIDAIPAAAIERMEVLTDGASAVYGTDAVAGVINVITKRTFQGAELSLTSDWSSRIDAYGEHEASITGGFGNLGEDNYNVYGSLNFYRRDPITLGDLYDKKPAQHYINEPTYLTNFRLGTGSAPGVFNPGSYFAFGPDGALVQQAAPGCPNVLTTETAGPRCIWQTWMNDEIDGGARSDRVTGYLSGRMRLGDSLEGFAEATYTDIDLKANGGTPRTFNSGKGTTSWFARNTGGQVNTFSYPFMGPNNVYNKASPELKALMGGVVGLNYLLQDVGDSHFGQRNTDQSYRVMAGLRGSFGEWDWDAALTTAGTHSVTYQTINVNLDGFAKAFGPFTIDPATGRTLMADNPAYQFGVISEANAALLREAYPTFDIQSWTRLTTLDAKVEGTLFELPAGEVRTAFGANLMRESFFTPGNTDAANGRITQQGGSWFDGKRTVGALFAEAVAPITKDIEIDAALRLDKYPNFAANLAPKLGVKYRAMPELLLRGTYSEGFRAPNLAESGTGGIFAQLGGYRDGTRCKETNAIADLLQQSQREGDVLLGQSLQDADCSRTVARMTQPNKDLKPEKAKIATVGLVFEPTKWLSLSADYWFLYRRNEIAQPDYGDERDIVGLTRYGITDNDRANLAALQNMCADPASGVTCPGTLPTYSVGNVASVIGQYKNYGATLVDGFDIDAKSRFSLNEWGRLNLGLTATIARRNMYYFDEESGWYYGNTVGYWNNPKLRASLNADWSSGAWTTSLHINYVGRTKWAYDQTDTDNVPANCTGGWLQLPDELCRGVPSWWTANLGVSWTPVKDLRVGVTVKNLFNRLPYYDPANWIGIADHTNPYGRSYSVSMNYKY